ncbi:hypothetical protein JTE90_022605 [Oedothorax gibbosus]|uniref:Uncharacterized protein n=1 Tax=Oedothorax gibbosus TaxID=931172 RepID=A0AAV6TT02_9ARAC|nr:hypothetical protein JTE90_022605 [Oedothorax gibbosus]
MVLCQLAREIKNNPTFVFGYKGPNQRDFLLRHGFFHIVDVGTIGVPSLSLLKQLYGLPFSHCRVSLSKCALAAVQSIAAYMLQQNLIFFSLSSNSQFMCITERRDTLRSFR